MLRGLLQQPRNRTGNQVRDFVQVTPAKKQDCPAAWLDLLDRRINASPVALAKALTVLSFTGPDWHHID
jgi:hypothetical protein